ncbi:MAG: phosphotransferase family protein [Nocardioides sp.]|uniref:phosphotransferase family protein n=1 Tax=Nocardioides sp. TaxID=35761 RepID=UPI003F125552
MTAGSYPAPPHATARRLEWQHLPPALRARVERRIGSKVVGAASQGAGFTPGFASVLTCADGSRHFVKAASVKAQRPFAESYRLEAQKLAHVPRGVPAPHLVWCEADDDWVALETAYVPGATVARPWSPADLEACLDALEVVADALTPAPPAMRLDSFADDVADWPTFWGAFEVPSAADHVEEAAELAADFARHTAGDAVVHTDVRADNLLVDADGKAWLCDWNWLCTGAPWLDSLLALIGPRGDGLDVEQALSTRRLLREVPAESFDAVLALVTGYFLKSAGDPVPRNSPYVRRHQQWQGEVCWEWLCERRGWS